MFLYDGDGGRVKKTANGVATLYIGKLFECVLPCTPDDIATQYIFAGGERIASRITGGAPPPNPESDALVLDAVALSTTLYYHGDHLGSSSVITDADGRPQQRLAYMPYGATQANSGTLDVRHKYTGQELDAEIGLYFYNARYYDPVLGRFTQADTIVPNPANPQTLNRYSYALNNPMRYTDPTGHEATLSGDLQVDPAYYDSTPDPSSSSLSTDFTSANPYSLNLSVPDLTIATSFAPLPTASDITATSTVDIAPSSAGLNLDPMDTNGRLPGTIYITGHGIFKIGPTHLAVEYTGVGLKSNWISSGPRGGLLVSGQDQSRMTDAPPLNVTIGQVRPPAGMTPEDYFVLLQKTDTLYCDCLDYDLFPGIMNSYNSNSYVNGIIQATGGTTSVNFDIYYGGPNLVPPQYFRGP